MLLVIIAILIITGIVFGLSSQPSNLLEELDKDEKEFDNWYNNIKPHQ